MDPALGSLALSEYALAWLAGRGPLRPSTRAPYADHIRRFVSGPYPDRNTGISNPHLGERTLRQVGGSHVIHWHRWVCEVSAAGIRQCEHIFEGSPRWNRALRSWAQAQRLSTAKTGRFPDGIKQVWIDAGCPGPSRATNRAEPGATQAAQAYRTPRRPGVAAGLSAASARPSCASSCRPKPLTRKIEKLSRIRLSSA